MAQQRKVIWDNKALIALLKALEWIGSQSHQQAERVELEIFKRIDILKTQPERFPPDKYKKNNHEGAHCAFETNSYRVTYFYSAREIQIIDVRHVKQEPKKY